MNEEKMIACPRCKGDAELIKLYDNSEITTAKCRNADCKHPSVTGLGEAMARKLWNIRAGGRQPEPSATAEIKHVCISDLLAAETTLKALHDQMAAECQAGMDKWPRDWMQNHVNERAAIIKVRNILISRAEAANADLSHADET